MSSFIGVYGKNDALKSEIKDIVSTPDFTFENNSLFICSEGNPLNTHYYCNSDSTKGWISCGIGITSEHSPRVLKQEDWEKAFDEDVDLHQDLNGHFAIIKWSDIEVEFFTDRLGMRNIFLHQNKDYVLFSTRLDWMLKLVEETDINWKLFGSNWLSINPFSSSCFINRIDRLAQGGYAHITESNLSFNNKRWIPKSFKSSPNEVIDSLQGFSSSAMNSFSKTSLGLSGGLDSRVLLALLASKESFDLSLYTFDLNGHPDVTYATQINKHYVFKHEIIPIHTPESDVVHKLLSEITSRTMLSSSIFHIEPLLGYRKLGDQNTISVDGGFGEIARRRYLKGIELKARQAVFEKSIDGLLPYLSTNKADIFSSEIVHEMKTGLFEELSIELESMPSAKEIGVGNWLDIFSIRSRCQNLSGLNQELIDETLFHIMPFVQPDFLDKLLRIPEKERVNAGLYRTIIQDMAPSLSKIPLVKGDDVYPYWMKDISSMMWMKTKRKFEIGFKNTQNITLMLSLEEYIRDIFSSQEVREQSFYDLKKIDYLITEFYKNRKVELVIQVGFMLSFEAFRKEVY
mgnify:CR=1 FL=1|tara:strand:+ start:6972 stop:8687 length:1716 start_codon:yes stop_codon:yes gene_type:complete